MIVATTPTHEFKLPVDCASIEKLRLTYVQDGAVVLRKTEKDVEIDSVDNMVRVTLTQEETNLFEACPEATAGIVLNTCALATAEIRLRMLDGNVVTSKPISIRVHPTADNEVL